MCQYRYTQEKCQVSCSVTLALFPWKQGLSLNLEPAGSQQAPVGDYWLSPFSTLHNLKTHIFDTGAGDLNSSPQACTLAN